MRAWEFLRRILAWVCAALFTIVVSPLIREVPIKFAERVGGYDYLFAQVGAALNTLASLWPWLIPAFTFVLGLTVGVWLDALVRRKSGQATGMSAPSPVAASIEAREHEKRVAQECIDIAEEIVRERTRWQQSSSDGPMGPDANNLRDISWYEHRRSIKITNALEAQFSARVLAALHSLNLLGIDIPQFNRNDGPPRDSASLTRVLPFYLSDIANFIGAVGIMLMNYGLEQAKQTAREWESIGTDKVESQT